MMKERFVACTGIRFSAHREGKEVGHAYLYVMHNDIHKAPFGLLEDLEVEKLFRGSGAGRELLSAVFEKVRELGCYKLVATSRDDGTRAGVHAWYLRLGFKNYGKEFRLDL